jgi:hypothetical protein
MRISCWIPKATNTHSQWGNPYYFSTPTTVARTRLDVTLYVQSLSVCLFTFLDPAEFPTKDKVATHVEANSRNKLPQGYFRNPLVREGFCPVGIQPSHLCP